MHSLSTQHTMHTQAHTLGRGAVQHMHSLITLWITTVVDNYGIVDNLDVYWSRIAFTNTGSIPV